MRYTVPGRPKRTYPVVIRDQAISELPKLLRDLPDVDRVFILYDRTLIDVAQAVQKQCGDCAMAAIPAGESSKCFAQAERLSAELFLQGMTERSVLICIGGGVAMDLGTFLAGTYAGGLRYIHVPTNLLAMADAAFGGRGYLDVGSMKNLASVRHDPSAVVVDMEILNRLPETLLRGGLVEIVKIAAMTDAEFFGWLCEHTEQILDRSPGIILTCVTKAIGLKTGLGERDSGDARLYSTFGHTVGHALEALTQFQMTHAEAVSIGMVTELRMTDSPSTDAIIACLKNLHMPQMIPIVFHSQALWDVMRRDRKMQNGLVRIAVPKQLGAGEMRTVTFEDLCRARL